MKFTTATLAAATAAIVSAYPSGTASNDTQIAVGDVFRLMTIRSASDLQYGSVQASNGGLLVNQPDQGASCDETVNYASFRLTEAGDLYLNTANPPQQIFVDRSGMGQGVIQFTTGVQGIGRNQERGPFAIQDGNLVFAQHNNLPPTGFQACPGAKNGGYSLWLSGAENPGGNSGCLGVLVKAVKEDKPISCAYTS
ncbi:hypothetical protein P153DRAFT_365930 [Dothidotthia symphoricarpi CBS 119687]|uniref:Cell wall protein PhiA n=1 Tax=Dothidotthia symphoricarpi CBS 119687 TaxID=1392245 RepID=A0A6A6AFG9_9PLEO|nr:uncharacterized protein P153DRAFT_365930 [Dothidotthia symphoricarpi CBS 119687]KAF2130306.1 hypothetical protein P153DRAFT_365930 [Dothidotthia symphoricarpi CBS 119687]